MAEVTEGKTGMEGEYPLVLRAELSARSPAGAVVTNTLSLSQERVWVASDVLDDVGDELDVRLSFPGLLEPVVLRVAVDEIRDASGFGAPRAVALRFLARNEDERRRIRALCARGAGGAEPSNRKAAARDFRVLLVEDDRMIRDMFTFGVDRYFRSERASVHVDSAGDVERAWELLQETTTAGASYDLAIVDYFLPSSDGAALVARMRGDRVLSSIPVVAISVGGADARRATLGSGADMFLDKPIIVRALFSTLARLAAYEGSVDTDTPKRVLVLDDSLFILEAIREGLTSAGFAVDTASNLAEFEEACAAHHDLILMDIQMPEAFGDDVAMLLRHKRGVQTKIFFLSSLADRDLQIRVAEAEVDGFISKAGGMDAVVRRVEEILGKTTTAPS